MRDSKAIGLALFHSDVAEATVRYRLHVANLQGATAAHIHHGAPGVNGPVVAFLAGPFAPGEAPSAGLLGRGTISADDLLGPLAGQPLTALIALIEAGEAYVNVHTTLYPGGEIRGQILRIGPPCALSDDDG